MTEEARTHLQTVQAQFVELIRELVDHGADIKAVVQKKFKARFLADEEESKMVEEGDQKNGGASGNQKNDKSQMDDGASGDQSDHGLRGGARTRQTARKTLGGRRARGQPWLQNNSN